MPPQDFTAIVPGGMRPPVVTPPDDPDWQWVPEFLQRAGEAGPQPAPPHAGPPPVRRVPLEPQVVPRAAEPVAPPPPLVDDGRVYRDYRELDAPLDAAMQREVVMPFPYDGHPGSVAGEIQPDLITEAAQARQATYPQHVVEEPGDVQFVDPADAERFYQMQRDTAPNPGAGATGTAPVPSRRGAGMVAEAPPEPPLIDEGQLAAQTEWDRRTDPLGQARGLIDQRRRLEQGRAEAQGGFASDAAGIMADSRQQMAETERARQLAAHDARQAYQRALDRIDRRAFFTELGPGGQIASIIAVAMGAVGGMLTGEGGNQALDMIEHQIDQFLENARTRADGAGQMVNMVDNEFESRQASDAAMRAALLDEAQAELGRATAGLDSQEAAIRAQELSLQLQQQADAARAQALRDEMTHRAQIRLTQARAARLEAQAGMDMLRLQRRMAGGAAGPQHLDLLTMRRIADLKRDGATDEAIAATTGIPVEVVAGIPATGSAQRGADAAGTLAVSGPLEADVGAMSQAGDVHGVGPIEGRLPDLAVQGIDWLTGRRGLEVRQRYAQAVVAWRHAMFGAALTPGEQEQADRATGGRFTSEDEFLRGLQFLSDSARRYGRSVPEVESAVADYASRRSGDAYGITPAEE